MQIGFDINPRKTSRHLWHSCWYGTLPAVCVFDHIRPIPYDPLDDRLDREKEEKQPRFAFDLISRVVLNNNWAESRVHISILFFPLHSLSSNYSPSCARFNTLFNLLNNSFAVSRSIICKQPVISNTYLFTYFNLLIKNKYNFITGLIFISFYF